MVDVRLGERTFPTSPPLALITCSLISYCDDFNLPLHIERVSVDKLTIDTHGWTEQLVYKFQYQIKRDFSEMKRVSCDLCIVREYSIEINVNKDFKPTKFSKE